MMNNDFLYRQVVMCPSVTIYQCPSVTKYHDHLTLNLK